MKFKVGDVLISKRNERKIREVVGLGLSLYTIKPIDEDSIRGNFEVSQSYVEQVYELYLIYNSPLYKALK